MTKISSSGGVPRPLICALTAVINRLLQASGSTVLAESDLNQIANTAAQEQFEYGTVAAVNLARVHSFGGFYVFFLYALGQTLGSLPMKWQGRSSYAMMVHIGMGHRWRQPGTL